MTSSCHSERSEESERIRFNVFRFFILLIMVQYIWMKNHTQSKSLMMPSEMKMPFLVSLSESDFISK